jgi:hypothetical protein
VKKVKKVRWDPIIAKLANYGVKQNASEAAIEADEPSRVKTKWIAATQRRASQEDFEALLHDLFEREGPVVKYQNPDVWNVYPSKRKSGSSN